MTQQNVNSTSSAQKTRAGTVRTVIICAILVISAVAVIWYSEATKPDLNADVELVNSDSYNIWNGSNRVLWMSGVTNATSDWAETIWFWVNTSQYGNIRWVNFQYYNGTHGDYFNASELYPQGSWNYRQWWTDYRLGWVDEFNTTTPGNPVSFTIPRQEGGTNITYQLSVEVWNGTALEFTNYNGTFVVRYSDAEVQLEQDVHVTTGVYWAWVLALLTLAVVAIWFLSSSDSEPTAPAEEERDEYDPDEHFLIARSNHLDSVRNNLRIGASILLTLGVSTTFWSGGVSFLAQGIVSVGLMALALSAFLAIVLSFSSATVKSGGFKLDHGLLPNGQTLSEYREHLKDVIGKKVKIIGRMESVIGTGLVYLATFALAGAILGWLPSAIILVERPISMIPVLASIGITLIDGLLLSYIIFGPKGIGVVDLGS